MNFAKQKEKGVGEISKANAADNNDETECLWTELDGPKEKKDDMKTEEVKADRGKTDWKQKSRGWKIRVARQLNQISSPASVGEVAAVYCGNVRNC